MRGASTERNGATRRPASSLGTRLLRQAAVPVAQALRRELGDLQPPELGEDIALDHAVDALDGFAAAPPIVFEIVGHRAGNRIGAVRRQAVAGGHSLLP